MAENSLVGYLGGQVKVNALHSALCLVIPSRNEAMSIVVLEAGMYGAPVLFTDRCGLDDFARAGAGVMVEASAAERYYRYYQQIMKSPAGFSQSAVFIDKKINYKKL